MDLHTLSTLFANGYNPDPNVRKAAELEIRKIGNEEGMIAALLQIVATDTADLAVRQACAVWIKNRVFTNYDSENTPRKGDRIVIGTVDRNALRSNVLRLLAASPSRGISSQLSSTLKTIISCDFPESWTSLTAEIKQLLNSGDIREVYAGCVASLEAIRAFRYRHKTDVMPQLINELFPSLVTIATNMLKTPNASAEIPTLLHLILKTYRTSIIMHLSQYQQSADSLVPWGQLLFGVVNLQVPNELVPEDEEERETCEWWKAKKWAYATLGRLFHRFGNPSQLPSTHKKDYAAFSQHFVSVFAPEILNIYLHQVELFVSNQTWLSKKCQYYIFQFFTECVKPMATWTLLKPHFETLVSSFVFPQLSFTPAKQAIWESDPIDYVRASVDEYETFSTPVAGATTFLFQLASNRTKATFMPILQFINTVLESNAPPNQRFGALNMTAALGPWILKHPQVKGNMEQFVLRFVTPSLTAPEPYLRAVACEVVGTLVKSGLQWSSEQNLDVNFRAVAACLNDPELPVRVHAVLSLTEFILAYDVVRDAVAQQVGKVVQDLLKLSDDTDLDILNRSMEVMVEKFQTELLPVAAQLTARLCQSYLRLAKESVGQEELMIDETDLSALLAEGDDDKTYAAMGIAKTIWTITVSIENAPEILVQVQEIVVPIIVFTLEHKLLDLFNSIYDLIDSLTFRTRTIAPSMWPVFELTYKLFKSDAVDFLDEMLPSLDNFVSYGTDIVQSRPEYKAMLLDIYTTAMNSEHLGENDRINGCKLAESVLLNLRGHVDDALQTFIITAFGHLDKAETNGLKLANLEVLINSVLYNPTAALHLMEGVSTGMSRTFFDRWFADINQEDGLPRVHDKKLSILTLCALLEMDPTAIPESVKDGWPGIVAGILTIFKTLPDAVEARKELEDAYAAEDSDDDDEGLEEKVLNLQTGDDEDVWDEDSAYLEMLAQEGKRLREKSEKLEDGEDIDDDSDESAIAEELNYISALENVNPYASFKRALTVFQGNNAAAYQAATNPLNAEQQALLMEVMKLADAPAEAAPS